MSLGGFFHALGRFARGAAVMLSRGFVDLFGQDTANQFGHSALLLLKSAAGQLALEAVQAVAVASDPAATDAEKHAAAFDHLTADAEAKGLSIADSLKHMLIEIAIQALIKNAFVPASN